jgi:hypothetical protein
MHLGGKIITGWEVLIGGRYEDKITLKRWATGEKLGNNRGVQVRLRHSQGARDWIGKRLTDDDVGIVGMMLPMHHVFFRLHSCCAREPDISSLKRQRQDSTSLHLKQEENERHVTTTIRR